MCNEKAGIESGIWSYIAVFGTEGIYELDSFGFGHVTHYNGLKRLFFLKHIQGITTYIEGPIVSGTYHTEITHSADTGTWTADAGGWEQTAKFEVDDVSMVAVGSSTYTDDCWMNTTFSELRTWGLWETGEQWVLPYGLEGNGFNNMHCEGYPFEIRRFYFYDGIVIMTPPRYSLLQVHGGTYVPQGGANINLFT